VNELGLPDGYGQIAYDAACKWWHDNGVTETYPPFSEITAPIREYYDAMAQGVVDYLKRVPA